jgi:hypothetical protein
MVRGLQVRGRLVGGALLSVALLNLWVPVINCFEAHPALTIREFFATFWMFSAILFATGALHIAALLGSACGLACAFLPAAVRLWPRSMILVVMVHMLLFLYYRAGFPGLFCTFNRF